MTHRIVDANSENGEPSQSGVIALLARPETHDGNPVVRIDTPISHVFIAGPKTYKLKRAVTRNFVDYSTLDLRRRHCLREIEINSIYAPQIYRGIVAINQTADGLILGGDGDPVDYVVEMATFDKDRTFDRLAESGNLEVDQVRELADIIATMHQAAPQSAQFGGSGNLEMTIKQVADEISASPIADHLGPQTTAWKNAAQISLIEHAAQIDARRRHGYVRRCHGDLHLANICTFDGKPTPFDAIEFSDEIASVDILYDLAFTLMDLSLRGLNVHANTLLSRYLNFTRDYSGLSLLPVFVSLRAAVRSMVAANGVDKSEAMSDAGSKLKFATRCLLDPEQPGQSRQPMLIAIGGLSGSGKSTLAKNIAPDIPGIAGAITIRSDICRKRLFGAAPEQPLPENAYTPEVSQRVYTLLVRDAARALRAGTSVILDATFIEGGKTTRLEKIAGSAGASFIGLWLSLDLASLQQRILARGADASDATPEVAAAQWQSVRENPAWVKLDASRTPEQVAAEARAVIGI
ncbi:MAG: AAA family ATPase [Alphaproteobacteria bacterium]|nr:AAA family ATPase [Alphaproteobacteria bacterium]